MPETPESASIAEALCAARASWMPLTCFPGRLPPNVEAAYAVQDSCLARWGKPMKAWKVGFVPVANRFGLEIERFVGPALQLRLWQGPDAAPALIEGGFAAIEAEVVLRLAHPVFASGAALEGAALRALVDAVHIGSEVAGSPIAGILDLGPIGAIADHGNCLEVIVGGPLDAGVLEDPAAFDAEVLIDGAPAGSGSAAAFPGGPLAALAFLLRNLAARGIDLPEGTWVSTGAITGVHPIRAGQSATVRFGGLPLLRLAPVNGSLRAN